MAEKASRLYRLLKLIALIQRGPPAQIHQLAIQLEVSRRTLLRDLGQLQLAGVPCYYDNTAAGYRIHGEWYLPPLQLSFDEALAVLVLGAHSQHHPAPELLHSGLLKLANALPRGLQDSVHEVLPHVRYHARPHALPSQREFYSLLVNALRQHRAVEAKYYSVREDVEFVTILRTYAVFFHRHSWYAIGHSDRDGGTRTFKLARFLEMRKTKEFYSVPPAFSLDRAFGGAWGIITDGPGYDVKIRFHGRGAHYVRETLWHPSQRIVELPNRECRLEVEVNGLDELIPWVLPWGTLAVVEEPDALRLAIRDEITRMLAQLPSAP